MKISKSIIIIGVVLIVLVVGYFMLKASEKKKENVDGSEAGDGETKYSTITKSTNGCYYVPDEIPKGYSQDSLSWDDWTDATADYISAPGTPLEDVEKERSYVRGFFAALNIKPNKLMIEEYSDLIKEYVAKKVRRDYEYNGNFGTMACNQPTDARTLI